MKDIYIGINAVNAPGYVEAVFDCYAAGQIVVPLTNTTIEMPPQITLSQIISPDTGSGWLQRPMRDHPPDAIAQINFTSGTEGKPKGIAITHRALSDTVDRLNDVMQVDDSIREYIGVPVYYSFGFGRCRAVCHAGGAAYIPENGFSLIEFAAMLRDGSVNALSAVPTLLRLLMRNPSLFQDCGARLRWIEIGSQYMAPEEKAALCELFPHARIVMHYGMTEASRTTFQVISETTGEALGGVGHAFGKVAIDIAPDGKIRIQGRHVAAYALIDGAQHSLTDAKGVYQSNDLGEFRDGQLWFLGRADDIINVSGIKVSAEAIEQKLHAHVPDPERIAVTPWSDPLRGEQVLVASERGAGINLGALKTKADAVLSAIHPALKGAIEVREVDHIPRTQTNKVRRKALRSAIRDALDDTALAVPPPDTPSSECSGDPTDIVIQAFRRQFPRAMITLDSTLETVGGTSLDYVELSLALEQALGHDPGDWHSATVREISESTRPDRWQLKFDQMAARAACAVLVVLAHVIGDTAQNGLKLPDDHSMRVFNATANYFKMPLFAFVSGWSFALLGTVAMRPTTFAVSTFKTLLVPTILSMIAFAGLVSVIGRSSGVPPSGLADVFLHPYEHFWFIQTLIFLVFITYVGMHLPGRWSLLFLGALVVLPIATPSLFATDFLSINGILILGPFYALGILLSDRLNQTAKQPILILGMIVITSLAAMSGAYAIFAETGGDLQMPHPVGFLIGLPLVFLCLIASAFLPLVKRIAPYTFYIYLWHVFATSATRRMLYAVGVEDLGVHIAAGVAAGIAIPILACLAFQKLGVFAIFSGRW